MQHNHREMFARSVAATLAYVALFVVGATRLKDTLPVVLQVLLVSSGPLLIAVYWGKQCQHRTLAFQACATCGAIGMTGIYLVALQMHVGFSDIPPQIYAPMLIHTLMVAGLCGSLGYFSCFVFRRLAPLKYAGVCVDCGYELHGLTENRCPECGLPF